MSQHREALGSLPIPKLLYRMSAPAIVGMLVMAAYNLADTFFIGRFVGPEGITAVTLYIPLGTLFFSLALMFGVGGSSLIARSLGAGESDTADSVLGNLVFLVLCVSALAVVPAWLNASKILRFLGAEGEVLPMAMDYTQILLAGVPFWMMTLPLNHSIRSEGNAKMAMLTMITGSLLNVALDPLFIVGFKMGMAGAALATLLSQVVSLSLVMWYFLSGRSSLHLRLAALRPRWEFISQVLGVGSSSFMGQVAQSIIQALVVMSLARLGGAAAQATFGICARISMFIFMPAFGIQQGFLPILGFNFGAKKMGRARQSVFWAMGSMAAILALSWGLLQLMPEFWVGLFVGSGPEHADLVDMSAHALRSVMLFTPLVAFPITVVGMLQSLGRTWEGLFLTMSRGFLYVIPMLVVLPRFFGLDGVWYAFPAAEVLSILTAGVVFWRVFPKFGKDAPTGIVDAV